MTRGSTLRCSNEVSNGTPKTGISDNELERATLPLTGIAGDIACSDCCRSPLQPELRMTENDIKGANTSCYMMLYCVFGKFGRLCDM